MAMMHLRHRAIPRSGLALFGCALAASCALLVTACGTTPAPTTGTASSHSASTASSAKISLQVTYSGSATTPAGHYTLRCEPAGGTVPDASAACAKLLKATSLFAGNPAHVMCPMVLANAGHAEITGTYLGRPVHETVVDGGCTLGKWATLREIFN
jgi:Subtilisin inhibitor-like